MGIVDKQGVKGTIQGRNQKVHIDLAFMDSKLQLSASLKLSELAVKYLPMIAMFAPSAKAHLEDAKRHIEEAIREAR